MCQTDLEVRLSELPALPSQVSRLLFGCFWPVHFSMAPCKDL